MLAAASVASAQTPGKPRSLASAGVLFHRYCSVCHGLSGNGGRGPELVSGRWSHGGTDADLARVISKGVPGSDMPAFGDRFSDDDYAKLIGFIRSLSSSGGDLKVTGNAVRGREIYWGKGACNACHMIDGQGGLLGPDLSRIGAQRSPASVKESIVSPSATIVSGYDGVRVTAAGRAVTGARKNEDNFSIQVFDGERVYSFDKTKIERVEELQKSLMPAVALSPGEVDDLVAYLYVLRGKQ